MKYEKSSIALHARFFFFILHVIRLKRTYNLHESKNGELFTERFGNKFKHAHTRSEVVGYPILFLRHLFVEKLLKFRCVSVLRHAFLANFQRTFA